MREYQPLSWNLHTVERGERRDDPTTGIDEWKADLLDHGAKPHTVVSVRILPAPAEIARYLRIESGAMVLCRRRVGYADGAPVAIADSWFPEKTRPAHRGEVRPAAGKAPCGDDWGHCPRADHRVPRPPSQAPLPVDGVNRESPPTRVRTGRGQP